MNLETLREKLQRQIDASRAFTIDDATLERTGVGDLIEASLLGGRSIRVISHGTIPPPSGGTLTVQGSLSILSVVDLPASVAFRGDGTIDFVLAAALAPSWRFEQSFPEVIGSDFWQLALSDAKFLFSSAADARLAAGLNFAAKLGKIATVFRDALRFFNLGTPGDLLLQGALRKGEHGPEIDVRATLDASVKIGPLSIGGGYIGARLTWDPDEDETEEELRHRARRGFLGNDDGAPVDIAAHLQGQLLPHKTHAPREWLGDAVRYTPTAQLVVGGAIAFAGKTLDIAARIGEGMLELTLDADQGFGSLADLATLFSDTTEIVRQLPNEIAGLGHFGLQHATVLVNLNAPEAAMKLAYITATFGINKPWTILGGEVSVEMLQVTAFVKMPLVSELRFWSVTLQASAMLGAKRDLQFDLEVALPSLNIEGALRVDRKFKLPELASRLIGEGAVQVPPDLVTLTVNSIGVSLKPRSGAFRFHANGAAGLNLFGEEQLGLRDVSIVIDRSTPKTKITANLAATLSLVGYAFEMTADIKDGIVFRGALPKGVEVSATTFLERLLRKPITLPPEVPDFLLSEFEIDIDSKEKSVSIGAKIKAKWKVRVANVEPSIEVAFAVKSSPREGKREYVGYVQGTVDVGDTFVVAYRFGDGVRVLQGTWTRGTEGLDYAKIGRALGISTDSVVAPLGLEIPDFGLQSATLTIDLANYAVRFTAVTTALGTVYFAAEKLTDGWGFVFGAAVKDWRISQLPGELGRALKPLDFIVYREAFLMIATRKTTVSSKQIPALGDRTIELVPGLNLGAQIDVGSEAPGSLTGNLKELLGPSYTKFFLRGAIGLRAEDIFVEASLDGPPIEIPKTGLKLVNPFVKVNLAPPALAVGGGLIIPVGKDEIRIVGRMMVNVQSLSFAVDAKLPAFPDPMGFVGIQIREVGALVQVGMPGDIGVGLTGALQVGKSTPSTQKFGFVFAVTAGPAVNPKYFCAEISNLDLQTLAEAVVPSAKIPEDIGRGLSFRDFLIYWAIGPVMLPDGTQAKAGFNFHGHVNLFQIFQAKAGVGIDTSKGLEGNFEMTPIRVNPGGTELVSLTGNSSLGGPMFAFKTTSSPFLVFSAYANILGVQKTAANGRFELTSFVFEYEYELMSLVKSSFTCYYKNLTDFAAKAEFKLDLNLDVGPYVVNGVTVVPKLAIRGPKATFNSSLAINPQVIARFSLELHFAWHTKFDLVFAIDAKELANDLSKLWSAVLEWIRTHLAEFFAPLIKDVQKWLDAVRIGVLKFEKGIADVASALYTFFAVTAPDELAKALRSVGAAFQQIVDELVRLCGLAIAEAAKIVTKIWDEVCAMGTAWDQLKTGMQQPFSGRLGTRVMNDLARTEQGRALLSLYLVHEPEIAELLGENLDVRAAVRALGDTAAAGAPPVGVTIDVLRELAAFGSDALRDAATAATTILTPFSGATYDALLDGLAAG